MCIGSNGGSKAAQAATGGGFGPGPPGDGDHEVLDTQNPTPPPPEPAVDTTPQGLTTSPLTGLQIPTNGA